MGRCGEHGRRKPTGWRTDPARIGADQAVFPKQNKDLGKRAPPADTPSSSGMTTGERPRTA